jgi:hypothetical protein
MALLLCMAFGLLLALACPLGVLKLPACFGRGDIRSFLRFGFVACLRGTVRVDDLAVLVHVPVKLLRKQWGADYEGDDEEHRSHQYLRYP